jgi:hypothetical protein
MFLWNLNFIVMFTFFIMNWMSPVHIMSMYFFYVSVNEQTSFSCISVTDKVCHTSEGNHTAPQTNFGVTYTGLVSVK